MLLLHGALGAKSQFEPLLSLLPAPVPVHSFNLAGHGGEPFPQGAFSIEDFAQQLLEWLDAQGLPTVRVFGYSMGGYVALEAARQHPARFSKIFTLATKFDWTPETARQETAKLNPEVIAQKVPVLRKRYRNGTPLKTGTKSCTAPPT
jgi:pimeloyl-ACP methyl ester carboxylesterase